MGKTKGVLRRRSHDLSSRHVCAVDRPDCLLKRYLGDGVYAALDNVGGVWLTAENGIVASDAIYLEPEVISEFFRFTREGRGLLNGRALASVPHGMR